MSVGLPTPDMTNAEIAEHFREAGLSILHLAAVSLWTIPDILTACITEPEALAEGYRAGLEEALSQMLDDVEGV
ncbi:hypothetical protein EV384_6351 [Micromonospora kangleipakensis]|uniref:Uncharacterized protein n=1 Tax=Micromonospora kangleipakensis TaxID=1077942 RepID=A0A4Q8BJS4_9ACTN|nr:hypothetical protein [Micromonospora kangleipakensis]RZU77619.1 hypothetical protein EV384_6351 [Micromonospora kangleipakensis]